MMKGSPLSLRFLLTIVGVRDSFNAILKMKEGRGMVAQ
jgi:hypothetical protein